MKSLRKRFWEVDFLRGVAVVMMIISNFVFDLTFFGVDIYFSSKFWWYFAHLTAGIFIFLVGVSLTLSYSRAKKLGVKKVFKKYLQRGLKIFSLGMLITLVTYVYISKGFIIFGILHFIGIAIILGYFFLRFRYTNLFLGAAFVLFGIYLRSFTFDFPWLLWLGLIPKGFYTLDYFPIFPWFGIVLMGIFTGNSLYPNYKRKFRMPDLSKNSLIKFFCFLGRNSLKIYLFHQPVIFFLLYLANFF